MLSITQFEEHYLLKYNKCVEFILDKEFVDEKLRIFANNLSNDKSTFVIFSNHDGDNSITYDQITSIYKHSILAFGDDTRGAEFKMKLSNQAIGAIMMALQKGIMEQADITEILQGFEVVESDDGLIVENPPIVSASDVQEPVQEQP